MLLAPFDLATQRLLVRQLVQVDVSLRFGGNLPLPLSDYETLDDAAPGWARAQLLALRSKDSEPRDTAPRSGDETVPAGPVRQAPDQIGAYQLVEQVGQGGMGTVWRARQTHPITRDVAIKLIRGGRLSTDRLSRFESEQRALAVMDHPNIAKILDAGTLADGRPWFAMEFVDGVKLTRFCRSHQLSVAERLTLFVDICAAVQHAHQKGIIHRDLKPSNVMVCQEDRPVPRVIDFGLLKVVGGPLHVIDAEQTTTGMLLGTLRYMSPEQTGEAPSGIDTRTDIYSLGVLLYELLTDTTPIRSQREEGVSVLEMLDRIRNHEVPPPSRQLDPTHTQVYADRRTDYGSLQRILRGDLDWICLKALEKDVDRRYQTASEFAADVQRFLNGETVVARPASLRYRAWKFVCRNRAATLLSVFLLVSLLAGIVGTGYSMLLARKRADMLQHSNRILADIFADLNLHRDAGHGEPVAARLAGRLIQASSQMASADLGDSLATADLERRLSRAIENLGYPEDAVAGFERAMAIYEQHLELTSRRRVGCLIELAGCYLSLRDLDRAVQTFESAAVLCEAAPEIPNFQCVLAFNGWGHALMQQEDYQTATGILQRGLEYANRIEPQGKDNFVFLVKRSLADCHASLGDTQKAIAAYSDALEQMLAEGIGSDLDIESCRMGLASCYLRLDEPTSAVPLLETVWSGRTQRFGRRHPSTIRAGHSLARAYRATGDTEAANELLEQLPTAAHEKRKDGQGGE
ncbi:MAG: tetratricopeptide repeat-containing serine/threonine protein kinase [Planctomycetaceae bacterium]|nr:tetratricopeptide repeat-containing serine/threonine protein kinase [Planctomycetaceae bacterium]